MRPNLFTASVFLIFLSLSVFGQSVTVTSKKTVYRRPKPMIDFKKTFTVVRPVVKAATPAISRKITASVSPENVLGLNIKEELSEYQWLEEANFKTMYNKEGVLCIQSWMMGTAAYPDSVTKYAVVDLKSGKRVTVSDVFTNLDRLAAKLKKMQQAEVNAAIAEIRKDPENAGADPEELFADTDLTANDLGQFSVAADGVTFYYDYGFPHVIQALQPDGEFKLRWRDLKAYIRSDGLLARFLR